MTSHLRRPDNSALIFDDPGTICMGAVFVGVRPDGVQVIALECQRTSAALLLSGLKRAVKLLRDNPP